MSNFNTWAARNKRNGQTNDLSGQSNVNQADVTIGVGSANLLNGTQETKEAQYKALRSEVTNTILIKIKTLLRISKSQPEFFTRLDDAGINLLYLVALGITYEENVRSYQKMRERGINTGALLEDTKLKSVDEAYAREIVTSRYNLPPLLNNEGKNINGILVDTSREDSAKAEAQRLIDKTNAEPVRAGTTDTAQVEPPAVSRDVAASLDEVSLDGATDNLDKTPTDSASSDWASILQGITEKTNTDLKATQKEERTQTATPADKKATPKKPKVPEAVNVFILAKTFPVPTIPGYKLIFINSMDTMNSFTRSKRNLLILTSDIPGELMAQFTLWIKGVLKTDSHYRITTLAGPKSISHETLIDGSVSLTKQSLDTYMNQHHTEKYITKGLGEFENLDELIK